MNHFAITTRLAASAVALSLFVSPLAAVAGLSSESEHYLKTHQIVQGAGEQGDLKLDKEINRAEFMKIVVKAAATSIPTKEEYSNCFPDVHTEWFAPYVCWANMKGYVRGYDDGYFHPERSVTEAEALKIIHEVFQLPTENAIGGLILKHNPDEWYVPYLEAGEKSKLVGENTRGRMHEKAVRGDIFEEVSRAITLSESGKATFNQDDLAELLVDAYNPPFTQAEEDIFKSIYSMIDYGFQPQTATGSSLMKFSFSGGDSRADVTISLTEQSSLKGSQAMFDRAQTTLGLKADIKASGQGEIANVNIHTEGSLLIDAKTGVYTKLNIFKIETADSSDSIKVMATSAEDYVKSHIGTWYKIPMDENMKKDLADISLGSGGKDKIKNVVKKLAYHLAHTGNFLVVQEEAGSFNSMPATHYNISVNEEVFTRTFPSFVDLLSPSSFNKFEAKKDMRQASPYLKKIFANFTAELWTEANSGKFLSSKARLLPVAFIFPNENNAMSIHNLVLEFLALEEYTYPIDVQIEVPTNAVDVSTPSSSM